MSFEPEKYLEEAVNSRDPQQIKIAISLYIDKDAGDFNNEISQVIKYINDKNLDDIWEPHREIEALRPQEEWDIDYIGLLQSDLMENFSKKRLNTILKVGRYVYGRNNVNTDNKDINEYTNKQGTIQKINNLSKENNETNSQKMCFDINNTNKSDKNINNEEINQQNSKDERRYPYKNSYESPNNNQFSTQSNNKYIYNDTYYNKKSEQIKDTYYEKIKENNETNSQKICSNINNTNKYDKNINNEEINKQNSKDERRYPYKSSYESPNNNQFSTESNNKYISNDTYYNKRSEQIKYKYNETKKNNHRININEIGKYGVKIIKYGATIVICGVEFLVNTISKKINK